MAWASKRDFLQQLAWREDLFFSCQIYLCPALPCGLLQPSDYRWLQLTLSSLVKSFNSRWSQRCTGEPYSQPDSTLHSINVQRWKIAQASCTRFKDWNVCVFVCFKASSSIADWFQTCVSVDFGNAICPALLFAKPISIPLKDVAQEAHKYCNLQCLERREDKRTDEKGKDDKSRGDKSFHLGAKQYH